MTTFAKRIHGLYGGLEFFNNLLLIPMFTVMVLEASISPVGEHAVGFDHVNLAFCVFFMLEWVLGFALTDDRRAYLVSPEKVADFVASIPFGYIFQAMRVARVARIVRVVRLIVRARRFKGKGTKFVRVMGVVGSTVFAGGLGLQIVEPQTVHNLGDAMWWALVTVSTVGYGDITPATELGRIVGAVLVLSGIGVFGYMAGFMTSMMEDPEEDEILTTVKRMEAKLDELSRAARGGGAQEDAESSMAEE